jgi:hypothetical protein
MMTNRKAGINVVRELMGDQAAQNSALPLIQTPSVPRSLATRSTRFLRISGLVPVWTGAPAAWLRCPS